jgi:hypothetical protein
MRQVSRYFNSSLQRFVYHNLFIFYLKMFILQALPASVLRAKNKTRQGDRILKNEHHS